MQLKNNLVRTFCEDQKGNLWIGTMSGVDRLGTDRLCRTDELGALGESSVWSLRADNQGGIWVGTFYDGIYYCNSDNYPFNPILLPAERKVKLINAMVEDKRGDLWILTDKFGMFRQSAHDGQIRYVAGSGSQPQIQIRLVRCRRRCRLDRVLHGNVAQVRHRSPELVGLHVLQRRRHKRSRNRQRHQMS